MFLNNTHSSNKTCMSILSDMGFEQIKKFLDIIYHNLKLVTQKNYRIKFPITDTLRIQLIAMLKYVILLFNALYWLFMVD